MIYCQRISHDLCNVARPSTATCAASYQRNKMKKFFAEIRQYGIPDAEPPIKRIECDTQRKADKLCDGWDINLNHDKYYTRAIEENE